jgi:hypothetical protein
MKTQQPWRLTTIQWATDFGDIIGHNKGLLAVVVKGDADSTKALILPSHGKEPVLNALLLYADIILANHIKAGELVLGGKVTGTLDNVSDGSSYGLILHTIIKGGLIQVGSGDKDVDLDGWHISSTEIVGQKDGADMVVLDTDGKITCQTLEAASGAGLANFHYNGLLYCTILDSDDALYKSTTDGDGFAGIVSGGGKARVKPGDHANDVAWLARVMATSSPETPTWGKRRRVKFTMYFNANSDQLFNIGIGGTDDYARRQVCFSILGNDIRGRTGDGSSGTTTSTGQTISAGNAYTFEIDFMPGSYAKFYINGTLYLTITTNLPSGTTDAHIIMSVWGRDDLSTHGALVEYVAWYFIQEP